MTNFEKYRDKIESIMSKNDSMAPAVKNGVPVMCDLMIDCNFVITIEAMVIVG